MRKEYKMLCIESHGDYYKNKVYKCNYMRYSKLDEFWEIYYENRGGAYHFGKYYGDFCNINKFKIISNYIKIDKKIILNKSILGIFNTKIEQVKTCIYHFEIPEFEDIIEKNLIKPIEEIKNSELFEIHIDKIIYILEELDKLSKMKNNIDLKERINKFSMTINKISRNIKQLEKEGKEKNDNIVKEKFKNYKQKQDELLESWNNSLDELGF